MPFLRTLAPDTIFSVSSEKKYKKRLFQLVSKRASRLQTTDGKELMRKNGRIAARELFFLPAEDRGVVRNLLKLADRFWLMPLVRTEKEADFEWFDELQTVEDFSLTGPKATREKTFDSFRLALELAAKPFSPPTTRRSPKK